MLIDRVIVGSMYTNAYIVSTGKKECLIIDPGAEAPSLITRLEAMNLIPKAIVFTHGHIDHTSATQALIDHYAERGHHISVGVHEADSVYLSSEGEKANHDLFAYFGENGIAALNTFTETVIEPEFFIAEGDTLLDSDLVVMHTPGHSNGSTCIYSEPRQALFSGDTLFFNTIGRTDVPDGNDEQLRDVVSNRIFELPPDTRVFPGHGPTTTIEREIKNNRMNSEGATI